MTRTTRSRYDTGDGVAVNERNDEPRAGASGDAPRRGPKTARQSFLYNRSVRSRLGLLVLIPLIGALVLGSVIFYNAVGEASTARSVERNAETAVAMIDAVEKLQDERDVTILAEAGRTGDGAVANDRDETDAAVATLEEQLADLPTDTSTPIGEAAEAVRTELAALDEVREAGADRYRQLINSMHEFVGAIGAGLTDPDLVRDIEVLDSLARSTEAASIERGLLSHLITLDDATAATQRFVSVSRTEQELLLEPFAASAEPSNWVEYSEARKNVDVIRRDVLDGRDVTPEEWWDAADARIGVMRGMQDSVAGSIVDQASSAAGSARLTAIGTAAVVLLVLGATVAVAYAVARSIVRPLRRLRSAALDAAGESGLSSLVSRIQADGPAVVRSMGDAVTPEGSDEIGQVASAFNEVHGTAVRVAGEQALLRQNLDTIVVNLSRRTQSLVDRQLGEIESLESRERDPDQLGTLFRIDHLATRVRRHAESLLVLAGVEEMRRQGVAAPVLDVVRTAVGEVEQYPRVKFGVMPTDLVVPSAVDDVAHLLAELLDNATEFSAPSTAVTVTSQPLLGGGLRLQVTDSGLGIPPDQLATLNQRLQEPGDIDVAASRTLGIYVVARLGARHDITVRLIPAEGTTGTIAQVDLPAHLIVSPLDTTDGVLQAIQQPTDASSGRTESLLNQNQQPQAAQQSTQQQPGQQPAQPAEPVHPAQPAPQQPPSPRHSSPPSPRHNCQPRHRNRRPHRHSPPVPSRAFPPRTFRHSNRVPRSAQARPPQRSVPACRCLKRRLPGSSGPTRCGGRSLRCLPATRRSTSRCGRRGSAGVTRWTGRVRLTKDGAGPRRRCSRQSRLRPLGGPARSRCRRKHSGARQPHGPAVECPDRPRRRRVAKALRPPRVASPARAPLRRPVPRGVVPLARARRASRVEADPRRRRVSPVSSPSPANPGSPRDPKVSPDGPVSRLGRVSQAAPRRRLPPPMPGSR